MAQDVESESELRNLAAVPYQLISPANNSAIIGIFQDSMLGCFRFTRENINFAPRDAMNLLMMFNRVNEKALFEKGKDKKISSFEILSQIMPPLSIQYKTDRFDQVIEIKNGKYIRGQLDKSILGARTKGLIQRTCNDFGNMTASDFIDDLQNIVTEYMKSSAYSVGISDLISDNKTNQSIIQVITDKKKDVKKLIDQTQIGIFENNTGKTNEEEFETQVNNILNQASAEAGKIGLKSLNKDNRFVIMENAGSKGSELNIAQMISCLGQQNVDGKRIPYGFEQRTLPHFTKFDDSPLARGFVESSYINGLSPQELFFHAMGGRVGLIDTAVKTSTTGYIQRRIIKGLEDLMVNYDMTLRTNKGKIVQFTYGDDGIDAVKIENQQIPIVGMSIQEIYAHYNLPDESAKAKIIGKILIKNTYTRYKKQQEELNKKNKEYTENMIQLRNEIIQYVFKHKGDNIVNCPVAFAYIINNIQGQQNIQSNSLVDITPLEVYEMIERNYEFMEQNMYVKPTKLFKALYNYYLSPKDLLFVKRFNRSALTILLETISLSYKRSIVAPGEMVGMIAAQSIGEVSTQMTLNSVTFETPIIVRNKSGEIKKVHIGEFIENKINIAKKLEYYKDKDTTYAELEDYYEIPSCDEDGNILWKQIEAVTKHPVINKDGTNTMLKITTHEEREVIATKAKSFLKLINGKITAIDGDSLKVGDYLPVSKKSIDFTENKRLELRNDILCPFKYIYSSEVEKAKLVMNERNWWSNHQGVTFRLPYARSDSFVAKVSDKLRNGCKSKTSFTSGCVYTKQTNMNNYTIPETIQLDYNFGYLLGAYSAEGCMTKTQISIANNDIEYFEPILKLCADWNITTKIYKNENKNKEGWTSQDLRIYNTVLCHILENLCGKLSHNKFVSDKIIFSNKECLLGFLDAYIGGDGSVKTKEKIITMSSVSKNLLIDVQQILNILNTYSYITKYKKPETNNRGSKNIKQLYNLFITGSQIHTLASMLNIRIKYKQENLKQLLNHEYKYNIHKIDTVVPNEIDGELVFQKRFDMYSGVIFDKIKTIEEVSNTTNYAYDLTVADTRNFNTYNGLAIVDTFHFAGVSSKSNVTRGVPRIEEILSLSSEPKNPSLTVYLNREDEADKEKASAIMYMIEHTKLEEIVESVEICFDPDDLNTLINEDKATVEQYRKFESMIDECNNVSLMDDTNEKSKWIVRMTMDPNVMLEKNITMDDVNFTLKNSYGDEINCIYSDYNDDKLIFRIRMNNVLKPGAKGKKSANPLDQSDHIYILKNFQDQLLHNIVLRGIKGINKVILRKIKDNVVENSGVYKKQDIWVLDTVGTNLMDILALDYIDPTRTFSNDIVEIFHVLGIEAARQAIYNEIVDVIEFDGTYINSHHFSVLCDRMTATSKMISIFRHGINNDNIGPIAKASFEETPEMFLKAAKHAELDTMKGISANVMMGQQGFYGTSVFQVVLDLEEMMKLEESMKYEQTEDEKMIEEAFGEIEEPGDLCSTKNLTVQNNVVSIKFSDMGGDNDYNPGFM
jgi:DNA-directed RNA polymerase beta' subunit